MFGIEEYGGLHSVQIEVFVREQVLQGSSQRTQVDYINTFGALQDVHVDEEPEQVRHEGLQRLTQS